MFLFSYTVPVVLKEEWKPTNVVVALLFSPIILYLVKGSILFSIKFHKSLRIHSLVFLMLFGSLFLLFCCYLIRYTVLIVKKNLNIR